MVRVAAPLAALPWTRRIEPVLAAKGLLKESVPRAVSWLERVSVPEPPSVELPIERMPLALTELAAARVRALLSTVNVCVPLELPRDREFSESVVEESVTVYVPARVMETSSPVVGTVLVLQLAAVLKSPPAALIQLTAARRVRDSSASRRAARAPAARV